MVEVEDVAGALRDIYKNWWKDYTIAAEFIATRINDGRMSTLDDVFQYIWTCFPGGSTAEIATDHLNTKLNLNLKDRNVR